MTRRIFIFLVIFTGFLSKPAMTQFNGGICDGHALVTSGVIYANTQNIYCTGGSSDGHSMIASSVIYPNTQNVYCTGGNNDGHALVTSAILSANSQSLYCTGGNSDGHSLITSSLLFPNSQNIYCTGGNSDGHSLVASSLLFPNSQSIYCTGGNNDGHSQSISSVIAIGTGLWTGNTSTDWTVAGNWSNATVPTYLMDVSIPAGRSNYPVLSGTLYVGVNSGTYQCKNLAIQENARITTSAGFNLYGTMTVSGSYTANNNTDNSQLIYSGGNLVITPTGWVNLGNQSSGSGLCDLVINSSGQLNVAGGVLYIDDQLNLSGGGTFNMTSGSVFINKYGIGSVYSASYPGSFRVESGALGSIYGGLIKVNGKATSGSYSAVNLLSASFDFTSTGTLEITDGTYGSWDETEIRTVTGADFGNLIVNKPYRIVTIGTDALFTGSIDIKPAATLNINPGSTITVNGDITIEN